MDHPLRSISYVADIGQLVVVMARRRFPQQEGVTGPDRKSKLLCHILESEEVSPLQSFLPSVYVSNMRRKSELAHCCCESCWWVLIAINLCSEACLRLPDSPQQVGSDSSTLVMTRAQKNSCESCST